MASWKYLQRCIGIFSNNKNINMVAYKTKWKPPIYLFSNTTMPCSNNTVEEIMRKWCQRFEETGIPESTDSIKHIIAHVIGISKFTDIVNYREKHLNAEQMKQLESLCQCRLLRMPVQYIIGEWDFRDITLKLIPPVFIPRPETEILVDLILKVISSMKLDRIKVLDIGCGSGAISLALVNFCKKVQCIAIDTNINACTLTLENAYNLNLKDSIEVYNATLKENGTINIDSVYDNNSTFDFNRVNQFDFIISNPPYIPTKKIFKLAPEIKVFEDIVALDGGTDGLKIIKPMIKYASIALKPGGRMFCEVDPVHPDYVEFLTKKYADLKLHFIHTYKDFCNNERFIELLKLE